MMAEMLDVDQDRINITQRFECLQISPLVANKTKWHGSETLVIKITKH